MTAAIPALFDVLLKGSNQCLIPSVDGVSIETGPVVVPRVEFFPMYTLWA
jgi:hypothetical protein